MAWQELQVLHYINAYVFNQTSQDLWIHSVVNCIQYAGDLRNIMLASDIFLLCSHYGRHIDLVTSFHKIRGRKVKTLTRNWRDHCRTGTQKLYRNILTGTAVFLNQKRANVCEHTMATFVMCSQTFALFWLRKMGVPVKIFRYSFRVPVLQWISSIFGKSFHFPFSYFVIFVLRYFPFLVVSYISCCTWLYLDLFGEFDFFCTINIFLLWNAWIWLLFYLVFIIKYIWNLYNSHQTLMYLCLFYKITTVSGWHAHIETQCRIFSGFESPGQKSSRNDLKAVIHEWKDFQVH